MTTGDFTVETSIKDAAESIAATLEGSMIFYSPGVQTAEPRVFGIPAAVVKRADALANRLTRGVKA